VHHSAIQGSGFKSLARISHRWYGRRPYLVV
jgi:hypothetical protein